MKVPLAVRVLPSLAFVAWITPPPAGRWAKTHDPQELAGLTRSYFGGLPCFEIGSGPVAVALHGWGGRPAQMAPLARRLAEHGYRAVIPTLPGCAGGEKTDIKKMAGALVDLVADIGQPDLIVAHSLAAMALRLVFPESAPGRVVLVAPALDVNDALGVFGERLGMFWWTRRGLRRRLESWDRSLWPTLSDVQSGQLSGADILIVHDPNDLETPFVRSAQLAAIRPATSIVPVDGSGHSRILSDPRTLDVIADFLSDQPLSSSSAA